MVIPVGNVLEKFMEMPLSFRKANIDTVRRIYQSDSYDEIQGLTTGLLECMLKTESGLVRWWESSTLSKRTK